MCEELGAFWGRGFRGGGFRGEDCGGELVWVKAERFGRFGFGGGVTRKLGEECGGWDRLWAT